MTIKQEISALKKYVRLSNYLAVSQIYLRNNILLEDPLKAEHIKPRLLGHWGTCPGINFVYAQINRLISKNDADFLYVVGPGHGFPAIQANLFLEGSLTHFYPEKIPFSEDGVKEICSKFSAPYGYPSHSNPEAPGAILEGGELGYSLSVSFGAALDNPNLIVACLVGDGEAETGPLSASWQVNKLLSPKSDGAVLPIVHVNGYKISGPTMFGRMSDEELTNYFTGLGYKPFIVSEEKSRDVYETMAKTMDESYKMIREIQAKARSGKSVECPKWPVIILQTPKGWTGVKEVDHEKMEGNCLSHQVIMADVKKNEKHRKMLEKWLQSYKINDLISFKKGKIILDPEIQSLIPKTGKACGSQKYAFGGAVCKKLHLPSLPVLPGGIDPKLIESHRGSKLQSSMKRAGEFLKEVFAHNDNIRLFSPDETYSNQLQDLFAVTKRVWQWPLESFDTDFGREGKVMEMLSEHTLFGLMHGYTVTGRHGFFVSYEAFVQVIASMADQYAKFIKASKNVHFRKPLPAMNVILTSLLERQDHNGFSHQNPSFISSMMEKDGEFVSCYFPPDANSMLITMRKVLDSRNALNLIVAGKKDLPQWLTLEEAKKQMEDGIMTWDFASDKNPDVVLTVSGDYATQEALAGIQITKSLLPKLKIRFVNVSELTALGVGDPTTATNSEFLDQFFTKDKGVVYNFHGYPQTIKKLLFDYSGSHRIKINGYEENGSTTTPFDMEVRNGVSRFHIVKDLTDKAFSAGAISKKELDMVQKTIDAKLKSHHEFIIEHGVDPAEIENWQWKWI